MMPIFYLFTKFYFPNELTKLDSRPQKKTRKKSMKTIRDAARVMTHMPFKIETHTHTHAATD